MISFQELGSLGRFGNQLFQYAFLRTTARRLGVQFYCPHWIGDDIFLLEDSRERAREPAGIQFRYSEPSYFGLNESALRIQDGTDIAGCFQTEKYFDGDAVRKWYSFKETAVASIREKYKGIDCSESTGVHVRLTDKLRDPVAYVPYVRYYRKALSIVRRKKNVLVFSDDIESAKDYFRGVAENLVYIAGNEPFEDLCLMSCCHDFVTSVSTLSWWGAWLNPNSDKVVVCPEEGPVRPRSPVKNDDYWPASWNKLTALRWRTWESYPCVRIRRGARRRYQRLLHVFPRRPRCLQAIG
jgi:hypothetical protein